MCIYAMRSIDASLRALRTDYVDLLLVHEPSGDVPGIWRALEHAQGAWWMWLDARRALGLVLLVAGAALVRLS